MGNKHGVDKSCVVHSFLHRQKVFLGTQLLYMQPSSDTQREANMPQELCTKETFMFAEQ